MKFFPTHVQNLRNMTFDRTPQAHRSLEACDTRAAAPLHVLYIHHAGVFGGASRSLIELIGGFPTPQVIPYVICPGGTAATMLRQAGALVLEARGISQFDCTRFGHYRGLRWLILLREAFYLPFTIATLLQARARWAEIDLVHINDTTPAVCIALARRLFRVPVVVHARALLAGKAAPRRMKWMAYLLTRCADAVVAIDENVRATLPSYVQCNVIHNGFTPGSTSSLVSKVAIRLVAERFRVAMVGSLSAMKGAYEFVEAARILIRKGMEIDFLIVGDEVRRLSGIRGWLLRRFALAQPVRANLQRVIDEHGLGANVHLLGFTTDVESIYDAIDVLCFPSHLDAPGRPVFEAAFSSVPSIVACSNPTPDTMVANETGICVPARDPVALASAIARLYHDRVELKKMGAAARRLALRNFDSRTNACQMLNLYRRLIALRMGRAAA
jgi:glycosyltransferase involved in cell wall biosynthesis